MSGDNMIWLSAGVIFATLMWFASEMLDRKLRAKKKQMERQMKRQSVWQLSLKSLSMGFLGGVALTILLGYHYLRVTPDSYFHGPRSSVSPPGQPRQLTRETQGELVEEVLAAMPPETENRLRQMTQEEIQRNDNRQYYDIELWIQQNWFMPVARWQSSNPAEGASFTLYAVWQRLQQK